MDELESRVLIALLDGWVSLAELAGWSDLETAQAAARALVDRGEVVRGELASGGFVPSENGSWLRRTRSGEARARELSEASARGPSPRKKSGRCG
jgi:hypothetical protein